MNLLDRYVIRAVLGGVFVVLAVLVALGALFLFANQQDDIGVGTYTALDAFWFVLLNLPQQVYELIQLAAPAKSKQPTQAKSPEAATEKVATATVEGAS